MNFADNHDILFPYYQFIIRNCKRYFPNNTLSMDLANDIYVKLSQQPYIKIKELKTKNELELYIYAIIRNERTNPSSKFNRLLSRERAVCFTPDNPSFELTTENLNRLNEFDKKILSLFLHFDTLNEASKRSRISTTSLKKYLNNIKLKLQ